MRRVITVSLNGNAYQVEDDAYGVLATYLDDAARLLAGNPDRQEIIADLEQAIADKCARFLSVHKSVLTHVELQQVITEMGPVAGDAAPDVPGTAGEAQGAQAGEGTGSHAGGGSGAGTAQGAAGGRAPDAPRRLYQISDGALISGVCNGLAAYFGVDVTLVRVLCVVLAFLTGGAAVLVYLVLMFVVPYASTSEEHAAAHGLPFNARVLVERAKQKYAQFAQGAKRPAGGAGSDWRREWRHARAEWRLSRRHARAQWRAQRAYGRGAGPLPSAPPGSAGAPPAYAAHVVSGLLMAVLGVIIAVFTVGWLLSLLSFVTTGAIFGWVLPFNTPFWVTIVILFVIYGLVTGPIKAARDAAAYPAARYPGSWVAAWDGLFGAAIVLALAWYGLHHLPEIRAFIDHLRNAWDGAVRGVSV